MLCYNLYFQKEILKPRVGNEIEYACNLSQINLIIIVIIEFLTSLGHIITELLYIFLRKLIFRRVLLLLPC